MGCRIIVGHEDGCDGERALLYCSTSEWAFGPVFYSADDARAFRAWCFARYGDPRTLDANRLEVVHGEWVRETKEATR